MQLQPKQKIKAGDAKIGMWLVYNNSFYNERIIDIEKTRGIVKITCSRFDRQPLTIAEFDADDSLLISIQSDV